MRSVVMACLLFMAFSESALAKSDTELLQYLSTHPRLSAAEWKEIYPTAKRWVLSKDTTDVLRGAALLDAWSEASIVHRDAIHSFNAHAGLWAEALGICVDRQTLPRAAGGDRFRRILFRHAWTADSLSALSVPERRKWLRKMVPLIHAGTRVVEPFYLGVLWSLPPQDRMEAVRDLSARMEQDSARLLVALTLHTLVPQDTIDAARDYLAVHGISRPPVRDLRAHMNELRAGDTEEFLWLRDTLRLMMRTQDPYILAAAMLRVKDMAGTPKFTPDLKMEALACVADNFKNGNLLLFAHNYVVLAGLYDQHEIDFTILRPYYRVALEHNPFDTGMEGSRAGAIHNSEASWITFIGRFAASPEFPTADRLESLRLLMTIAPDGWYEGHLRTVIEETAVKSGLLSRAEFEAWTKKRPPPREE